MPMTPVSSSMIAAVGFEPGNMESTGTLTVEFTNGRTYSYEGVPADEYQSLLDASSVGQYFLGNIKNQYRTK